MTTRQQQIVHGLTFRKADIQALNNADQLITRLLESRLAPLEQTKLLEEAREAIIDYMSEFVDTCGKGSS